MKKLLYILLAVATIGCSKEGDLLTQDHETQAVSFTITEEVTRANDFKTEWKVDDALAIFVGESTTAKQYKVVSVDADTKVATLECADDTAYNASSTATSYTAYYPYVMPPTPKRTTRH